MSLAEAQIAVVGYQICQEEEGRALGDVLPSLVAQNGGAATNRPDHGKDRRGIAATESGA